MEKDLASMSDVDLLDLLDRVSSEIKRRNSLRPKSAGRAAVEVMQAIGGLSSDARRDD